MSIPIIKVSNDNLEEVALFPQGPVADGNTAYYFSSTPFSSGTVDLEQQKKGDSEESPTGLQATLIINLVIIGFKYVCIFAIFLVMFVCIFIFWPTTSSFSWNLIPVIIGSLAFLGNSIILMILINKSIRGHLSGGSQSLAPGQTETMRASSLRICFWSVIFVCVILAASLVFTLIVRPTIYIQYSGLPVESGVLAVELGVEFIQLIAIGLLGSYANSPLPKKWGGCSGSCGK